MVARSRCRGPSSSSERGIRRGLRRAPAGPRRRGRQTLLSLPAVTYGVSPGLLFALLLVGGTVLAIAGGAIAYLVLPRHASSAVPSSDEPREPILTPLERAFALLEDSRRVDGAADQRRALELVAGVLVARGDVTLAQAARVLAWSKPAPEIADTNGFAVRARSSLGEGSHAPSQ